jgi:phospholipase C
LINATVLVLGLSLVVITVGRVGIIRARPQATRRPVRFAQMFPGISGMEQINQGVFIIKENRAFDNYFGTLPAPTGQPHAPFPPGT